MASLSAIFPNENVDSLRDSLMTYQDVGLAANALSENVEEATREEKKDEGVGDILRWLKTRMKSYTSAEKLKVDEEDLAMDFLHYYKCKEFDPKIPIKVQFRKQPGVDSGGMLRQAFCALFNLAANNQFLCLRLFTGPPNRVTPVYSSEHILTGIFEVLGKMISHSLVQGGPGFPYLAPAVYWYVATGDLGEAIDKASIFDIIDPDLLGFVERVSFFQCKESNY